MNNKLAELSISIRSLWSIYTWRVWKRDLWVWSRYWIYSFFGFLGEPLLYFLAIGYGLGFYIQEINGAPYTHFLAPALILTSVMQGASFETTYSSYTRMETQKTFQAIAVTPVNFHEIIAGEILWATTKSLLPGIAMLLTVALLGYVPLKTAPLFLPLMFLNGFLFASFGMLMTSFAKDYNFFSFYFILILQPMFLLSGTFFPLSRLPEWGQKLAFALPLAHPVFLARQINTGIWNQETLFHLIYMIVVGFILYLWSMKRMLGRLIR